MPRLKLNEIRVESFVTGQQKILLGGTGPKIDTVGPTEQDQCTIDLVSCPYSYEEC